MRRIRLNTLLLAGAFLAGAATLLAGCYSRVVSAKGFGSDQYQVSEPYQENSALDDWVFGERPKKKKFEKRAGCVIDQFNTADLGEGLRHNGKLVVGEAMGDLGGLTLAYRAYKRSLHGKEGPVLDGFTADQRFFLAFARVWASQYRPEATRLRLNTDPHPLPKWRANATLSNMPEFRAAFKCKAGDPMVRDASKECRLW